MHQTAFPQTGTPKAPPVRATTPVDPIGTSLRALRPSTPDAPQINASEAAASLRHPARTPPKAERPSGFSPIRVPEGGVFESGLLAYLDELHAGIGSLATSIEQQMKRRGYAPISKAGMQGYWFLNSRIDRPQGWRMKMVTRLLVPKGCETTDHTLLYQVLIDSDSAFDFPTILCARVEHPFLTEAQIYDYKAVWNSEWFTRLHAGASGWTAFEEDNGWFLARPAERSSIDRIKGYLLNLLDVNSVAAVSAQIVEPLLRSGDPASTPPVNRLPCPGLNQEESTGTNPE